MSESIELLQDAPSVGNEEQIGGDPNVNALKEYFKATKNSCVITILILMFISAQIFAASADFWVAFW